METIEAFNQALFLIISGTPATPDWLVSTALVFANYLIWLIPLLLAGMWLVGRNHCLKDTYPLAAKRDSR